VDKKFGTRNRNLGKMARFRNTDFNSTGTGLQGETTASHLWKDSTIM
jgi:hypothetical protein